MMLFKRFFSWGGTISWIMVERSELIFRIIFLRLIAMLFWLMLLNGAGAVGGRSSCLASGVLAYREAGGMNLAKWSSFSLFSGVWLVG